MTSWWQTGVLYQVYPRSFADSDGDGIGDVRGLIDHLDHLAWLGVDGVWLSPVYPSPNVDFGYDVADYCGIDPAYGTLEDLDELIARAGEHGIRVLMDLVVNHTSDQHPWFVEARSSRDSAKRDWYVWSDTIPNNWVGAFGGSAWEWDEGTEQYYLHNFAVEQPDLNWWNPSVGEAVEQVQRFWYDRGVAGFRIDMAHMLIKDDQLRDNPVATENDSFVEQLLGRVPVYTCNRPEVHDVLAGWRKVAESYDPPRLLMGETVVHQLTDLARFYDELQLCFNIPFQDSPLEQLPDVVDASLRVFPPDAWPLWMGGNHDVPRLATRWADGDPRKTRLALLILLALRGTPLLYQGDEIGLTDTTLTREDILDPVGQLLWPRHPGRDPGRTPMPWTATGGFTTGTPWLPLGDAAACNVADQRDDPGSVLTFVRDAIALRRATPDLQLGSFERLPTPEGLWAWRRGEGTVVALNLTAQPSVVPGLSGSVLIATDRSKDGTTTDGTLAPWEGLVIAR